MTPTPASPGRDEGARLYLFDDLVARGWEPFALTGPIGECLFGTMTLRERTALAVGTPCVGHLAGKALAGLRVVGAPPAIAHSAIPSDVPRVLLSSRVVLEPVHLPSLAQAATLRVQGEAVGWILPAGFALPWEDALADPGRAAAQGRTVDLGGMLLDTPWSLMDGNARRVAADVEARSQASDASHPGGIHCLGEHRLSLGNDVMVEPGAVIDLQNGPVRLDDGVRVRAFSRIEGPMYVGTGSTLLGGTFSRSSIGRHCKIRGEVEESVIAGYCNKAHDGFLGHAMLGRWVNLGAFTTNSDLKNNYGPVRVRWGRANIDTGLSKVGCFLGDHVKTGIGTLFNTGTVVGAGTNVFGGAMPPAYVPPFSWGSGPDLETYGEYRLDKFLEVAEVVMGRRGVSLGAEERSALSMAWQASRGTRSDLGMKVGAEGG